jgi:integrase
MKRKRRAGVEDRWRKSNREPTVRNGQGLRWLARYVDGDGRERSKAFGRKADAQAWLDGVVSDLMTGSYIDPERGAITFGSFYRDWSARQIWTANTRRAMALACESVPFGAVPFCELRASHVEAWVKQMQDNGLAPSTIRTRFQNARSVIRAAVRDGLLARDPSAAVKLPRVRSAAKAMIIPTPLEVGSLLSAADAGFVAFIALCAFAGLRFGEASAVKVSDIRFLGRELTVSRQVQRAEGHQVEIRAPKYDSERTVYLPDSLLALLSQHIAAHCGGDDPDRWLFGGEGELPIRETQVVWRWKKARKAAGVGCRLHDLRHFFASGLIRAGCDVVTVQRALGHHSATVTLNTYAHLWPDADDRTRKAAGELFAACADSTADPLRTERT